LGYRVNNGLPFAKRPQRAVITLGYNSLIVTFTVSKTKGRPTRHQNDEGYYRNNSIQAMNDEEVPKKYHEAVLDLYFKAAKEAYRVLRKEGLSVSM